MKLCLKGMKEMWKKNYLKFQTFSTIECINISQEWNSSIKKQFDFFFFFEEKNKILFHCFFSVVVLESNENEFHRLCLFLNNCIYIRSDCVPNNYFQLLVVVHIYGAPHKRGKYSQATPAHMPVIGWQNFNIFISRLN